MTPPHAYTKETLIKAYSWLQDNPEYKEEIQDTDTLVSLYLKGKNRLMSLKLRPLKQVSKEKKSLNLFSKKSLESFTLHDNANNENGGNIIPLVDGDHYKQSKSPSLPKKYDSKEHGPDKTPSHHLSRILNEPSWKMVQETQKKLNLNHMEDALKVLIALGFEKLNS